MMRPAPEPRVDTEPTADAALKSAIVALFDGYSIEVTPREAQQTCDFRSHLPTGTSVYVTWLRGAKFSDTVRACVKLRAQDMNPVPHIAARALADPGQLEAFLALLRDEVGVQQALVIGGALKMPAGAFDRTLQVLETGLLQEYGIRKIGVAGHPEGSPDIGNEDLVAALVQKNKFAHETKNDLYLVTQFFFDASPVVAWERAIRHQGNRLPVHAGLHGIVSIPTLLRHARNCGIGSSINVLLREHHGFLRLATAKTPEKLVLDLARSKLADRESRIEKCHLFPFGSFERTAARANALARGDFHFTEGPDGLGIAC